MYRDGPQTDYFIPFCVLPTASRPLVAYVGHKAKDSTAASLIICDGETGQLRASETFVNSGRLHHADRDYQHNAVAIADFSVAPEHPRVGLHWVDNKAKCHWRLFDVAANSLREAISRDDDSGRTIGVLLQDIDGDSAAERIVAKHEQMQTRQGKVVRESQVVLGCYPAESDQQIWELRVPYPTPFRKLTVQQQASAVTALFEFAEDRFALVDLARGHIIDTFDDKRSDDLPLLTAVDATIPVATYHMVVPSRDGVVTTSIGPAASPTESIAPHQVFDPRRQKQLISQGIVIPKLDSIAAKDAVRSIAALFVLIVMPLWYFGTMLWHRQWSLSWLLLAPAVVLLILMVGNSTWAHSPHLMLNLFAGMVWLLVIAALVLAVWNRGAHDNLGGKAWLFLVLGSLAVPSILLAVHYFNATDPDVRYLFSRQDAARLLFVGVCISAQLYWVVVLLKRLVQRIGRKRAHEIAA